jgi:hypothetical protein
MPSLDPIIRDFFSAGPALDARTIRFYGNCLAYWDCWHRLRFGNATLPLLWAQPQAVPDVVLAEFIQDHLATLVGGKLQMQMPVAVAEGLRRAGFNRRISCPTPQTTLLRLKVLRRAMSLHDLPYNNRLFQRGMADTIAMWNAAHADQPHAAVDVRTVNQVVRRLLDACSPDEPGLRDAAMVVLLRRLTPEQMLGLRVEDVRQLDDQTLQLPFREPVNQAQRDQRVASIRDREASILTQWIEVRYSQGEPIEPLEPLVTRERQTNAELKIPVSWVVDRLRRIAISAGLGHERLCTPTRLRRATELAEADQSLIVQIARYVGVGVPAVRRILKGETLV